MMPAISDIRQAFAELEEKLADFCQIWPQHVLAADVYTMPLNVNGLAPSSIPVESLQGADAIHLAQHAFQQLEFQASQHPATAYRLAGWIGIDQDLSAEIAKVNQQKEHLRQLILQIPERERNRWTRQALPHISLLQCYRQLVQWNPAPERLYFSWAGATPSSVHVSREEVLAQLERAKGYKPDYVSAEDWQFVIEQQHKQLAQIPPELPLIYRWRKAPHPRMMAYNRGQTSNAGKIVPANLPVFVVLAEQALPHVLGLKSFDIHEHLRDTPRADAALLGTVIERLGLYVQMRAPAKPRAQGTHHYDRNQDASRSIPKSERET